MSSAQQQTAEYISTFGDNYKIWSSLGQTPVFELCPSSPSDWE